MPGPTHSCRSCRPPADGGKVTCSRLCRSSMSQPAARPPKILWIGYVSRGHEGCSEVARRFIYGARKKGNDQSRDQWSAVHVGMMIGSKLPSGICILLQEGCERKAYELTKLPEGVIARREVPRQDGCQCRADKQWTLGYVEKDSQC
jgi:hypothetical protein